MGTREREMTQVGLPIDESFNPRHAISGMQDLKLEVGPDRLPQWSNAEQVVHYGGVEPENVLPAMPSRFV